LANLLALNDWKFNLNWLITGGCGFLGTALIKKIQEMGCHNIRIVDNFKVGTPDDLKKVAAFKEIFPTAIVGSPIGVELIHGDILNSDLANNVGQGCDIIVHLAANTGVEPSIIDPRMDMSNNIFGTFNYLESARKNKIKKFVFASSGAAVGNTTPPIHEEVIPKPISPYGVSKLAGEAYCSAYFQTYNIETIALRFSNVYGPGSSKKNSVIAKFIKEGIRYRTIEIYGDGSQTRDFIYIDDLIKAVVSASISDRLGGNIFQIASGKETSIYELVDKLINVLKNHKINDLNIIKGNLRAGDVKRNFSNIDKAKKLLSWAPEIEIDEGLKQTVNFFLKSENE
jgi:UDP-glucose 4-epimerase